VRVVADTGPLNYLVLIGCIDVLPKLYRRVMLPEVVRDELRHASAPKPVRDWMAEAPGWVEVAATTPLPNDPALQKIGAGERAAIALALSSRADLVLLDDRRGVAAAYAAGLEVVGTIGVLDRGADRGLVDLPAAVARLHQTNFRCRPDMLDALLAQRRTKKP
jgi:predicted nucleic acid-binding protein